MLKLTDNEKKALEAAQQAAHQARLEALASSPITENQRMYLEGKSFSEMFLNSLTRGAFDARCKCINDAKEEVIALAQLLGIAYIKEHDYLVTEAARYFFGKIPEEFAPGKTVSDIATDYPEAESLAEKIAYYLSMYWVKPDTFDKAVAAGYAIAAQKGESFAMAKERTRFNLTVAEYKAQRSKLSEEASFLKKMLASKNRRELYLEGLVDADEDKSRSAEAEKKAKFFAGLSDENLILWYLSRTVDKIMRQVDPFLTVDNDYTNFYKLDEIVAYVKAYKGSVYKNGAGEEKQLGDFNLLFRFYPYVTNGCIDNDVLKYIVGCNDWVLRKFLELPVNKK